MNKIKLTRTTITEYEADSTYYPGCKTLSDMAKVDASQDNIEDMFTSPQVDEIRWTAIEDGKAIDSGLGDSTICENSSLITPSQMLEDILMQYDPSLSTIEANMLLDRIVADIENYLGVSYSKFKEE